MTALKATVTSDDGMGAFTQGEADCSTPLPSPAD